MRRGTKTWVGRVGAAALVTFALGYVPYHVYARSGLARTLQLRRDLATLRAHNVELRGDNERFAREAEALRGDPGAIERVARAELGWVRSGEVIVDLSRSRAETSLQSDVAADEPTAKTRRIP
jgi:cell division protein FtsB